MRTRLMAVVTLIALALTGCSSGNAAAPAAQKGVDHNDADVKFSLEMIPHHQQTIMIVDMATNKGGTDQVRETAASLLAGEDRDIKQMRAWLTAWNSPQPMDASMGGHDMPGMVNQADIKALDSATGADFDTKWLALIVKHLENGVTMSQDVIKNGMHADTKALAGKIIKNQEKQIAEVKKSKP
ncbi:uncharacterized protein (DUF305 family) [Kibdelosporangium banguiense]|uniref:Uncharacterized protein (DUF305 family) n=1 Tax=Kibdelosporangium banguiense TaxID=1365924 RepID=A0ABS4TPD9_9PSEU|nr:DUF305 domain-containing protein [Kibdelosporangium banguiense]MBP2326267.1 uncharacterized protein (DUF305 family) [Kibdelosporangium banguiense]